MQNTANVGTLALTKSVIGGKRFDVSNRNKI